MKKLFLIMVFIALTAPLWQGCVNERCSMDFELYFSLVDSTNQPLIGQVYPIKDMEFTGLTVADGDTQYYDITQSILTRSSGSNDHIAIGALPIGGDVRIWMRLPNADVDTITIQTQEPRRKESVCLHADFQYNGREVCKDCDLRKIHKIIK